jgi:5-methyltetrahydrofolate--homocysteine methyltransferase
MASFGERIAAGGVLLGDGAMGTLLLERGLQPGQAPESVTRDHPEVLADIAHQYLAAGADIVETNTFGASPLKLALTGLGAHVGTLNRDAVRITREAVGQRCLIAASVGPCGGLLEPYGEFSADDVYRSFHTQLEHLLAERIDAVFVETMTDLAEASLAVRAAKDLDPDVPVAAMMTFDPSPHGFHTVMGVSVAQAASGLAEAGADLVGSNCGSGVAQMVAIADEFRQHTKLPLVIQPNAGLPKARDGHVVYDETPELFAEGAEELARSSVSVIGGCCGTTPEHVRAIRAMLDRALPSRP